MALDGNRLGPRKRYLYETDDIDVFYILTTDEDLALAGLGTGGGAPSEYDPANPPANVTICPAPRRFKPRVVHMQNEATGARKSLIAFSSTADLYAVSSGGTVTIDNLAFVATGRRGEQLTF